MEDCPYPTEFAPSTQRVPPNVNPVLFSGVGGLPGGFGRAAGGATVFSVSQLKTGKCRNVGSSPLQALHQRLSSVL